MPKKKAAQCVRWCWKSFCVVFFCKKNLKRDLIVLTLLVLFLGAILDARGMLFRKPQENNNGQLAQEQLPQPTEQEAVQNEESKVVKAQAEMDASSWTKYQNLWYGFSLKYPQNWLDPVAQKPAAGDMWEQKVQFRTGQNDEKSPFDGFDVEVYAVAKVKQVSATDEFPKLKNAELGAESDCADIKGHLLETGDYPAEEIYIPASDACYNATLFFTNTRDAYIYTVAPHLKDGSGLAGDPADEISSHMPEFFTVEKNWDLIDIQRPKSAPLAPKAPVITAPMPLSYIVVNGQLVCAKKNDHPMKSIKHKGKHMDMECCLDPDEYPNPHCYYPPSKYGKFL